MPRRIIIDHQKLIKMVDEGVPKTEIMKKFGYESSIQLKNAYMKALIAQGKVAAIKGGRANAKRPKEKPIVVGKRGSLILPAEMVAKLGIGQDDKFTIRKTKAGIVLKKA
jgi:hypothetical protein